MMLSEPHYSSSTRYDISFEMHWYHDVAPINPEKDSTAKSFPFLDPRVPQNDSVIKFKAQWIDWPLSWA